MIMGYPRKSRLKIWAQVKIVTKYNAPELIKLLQNPDNKASVARRIILTMEAFVVNVRSI